MIKRPYKDKPWIVYYKPNWFEANLLGISGRVEIDTSHPEWVKQVLIPTIEKFRQSTILSK